MNNLSFSFGSGGQGSGGGAGGVGDEQNTASSVPQTRKRSAHHRHTPLQIQRLEEFFKHCPHPDDQERRDLGKELGLKAKQIKFWFQNKRTQTKTQNERMDNNVLRAENERIQSENAAMKEVLNNIVCSACGGPTYGEQEHQLTMQKLLQENAYLKQEYENATKMVAEYAGKPMIMQRNFLTLGTPSSMAPLPLPPPPLEPGLSLSMPDDNDIMGGGSRSNNSNKGVMWETAISAMEELVRLMRVEEPLWIQAEASDVNDGFFYLPDRQTYERIFPRAHHLGKKLVDARIECSKASSIVNMPALQLVTMFMDADKWANMFPTIVGKARTLKVIDPGYLRNRNGALQLMYAGLHMLSPVVPPREYVFLRYCYQPEKGTWLIGDVSYDSPADVDFTYVSSSWRLPSGCMIQELPNGLSKVTWVEHVEVEHQALIVNTLFRNLVFSSVAFGAQRWAVALERMCQRIAYTLSHHIAMDEAVASAMSVPDGRRGMMKLGHRMFKSFCGVIGMAMARTGREEEYVEVSEANEMGVRVFTHINLERGQPQGTILTATAPLWLPLPPYRVFHYLRHMPHRFQWDVLCNENSAHEIVRISTGTHPESYISVIQTSNSENGESIGIIQETCVEPMGCVLAYAPMDDKTIKAVMRGEESAVVPVLPSGFVVVRDSVGRSDSGGGSILTVTLQILVSSSEEKRNENMESVETVNNLVNATLTKIKFALMNI